MGLTKIKPKRDFATDTRLFLAGRYYTVESLLAHKWHKEGKVWIQKVWYENNYENNIKCTRYV
ncbi:MAG TPA: hypothetical protein ENH82_08460 [bacterium]|nr:hypothetical protein [bacterium]